jgi:phosphatidate cytidylyltransferase
MRERLISAAVLVPVVAGVFLLGMPWLGIGIAILSVLAALEAARLLVGAGFPVRPLPLVVAPPLAVAGMAWTDAPDGVAAAFVAGVLVVTAIDAFRRQDVREGFLVWMGGLFGALYASLLAFLVGVLTVAPAVPATAPLAGGLDAGRTWLLVLLLTVWSFDTFAYLSGRTLRRGRFLNHISPNKTWSGVIGGTVAAIVVAAIATWAAGQSPLAGLVLGLLVAVTAQAGDVAESMLKRAAGQKDSGTLIPGHGGILDRVDSFLFAAPAMFAFLVLLEPLGILRG